ncbi:hypothetical protein O0L34_g2411 [Tuta absoluta]|nr:hypothetical protein O0L34_g2411 [Tuta absoluta]
MRCNRQEVLALATQPSHNFEREGPLLFIEGNTNFFRRSQDYTLKWFRLRGNLMFYLKGAEPWMEAQSFIVLGHHDVRLFPQDENGYWPFHIIWGAHICYRLAAFSECERVLWIKSVEMAPYEQISSELTVLQERLNRFRPVIDLSTFRNQKGIYSDINEVPICELALSCDNLLCDVNGMPPSPILIAYVKFHRGLCVRYGATEIAENTSNPCFSKTILFRASDGLTGDEIVRIVAYDVKERVTETTIPMGYISMQLSTIQEAQRLRVALMAKDNRTIGFVTLNGWSLEPSYAGSPSHKAICDANNSELPQRVLCHRRSQSLPPRLGLKLKCPAYNSLIRMNFAFDHVVAYRFHSGLGGDITVQEIMAESKICYEIPIQLLGIYIRRERELLEELLSLGDICGKWASRQLELVGIHVSLLKHYGHCKKRLRQVDTPYFKPSSRKGEASLEFAPVNLHLQRMWVHNETLNKTGFHDVFTVGAFAAHAHKTGRTGGLLTLVHQLKEMNNSRSALMTAAANKIQSDYDNVVAMRRIRDDIVTDLDRVVLMLLAKQGAEIVRLVEEIKIRLRSFIALWDPNAVEEALSYMQVPQYEPQDQTMSTILHSTERLSLFDAVTDVDLASSSSGSSADNSPTMEFAPSPTLSASVPNISCPANCPKPHTSGSIAEHSELHFQNEYFRTDRTNYLNTSFRSVRSARLTEGGHSLSFESRSRSGSLRRSFTSSPSLEQVSYRTLLESSRKEGKDPPEVRQLDMQTRRNNLVYLKSVKESVEGTFDSIYEAVVLTLDGKSFDMSEQIDDVRILIENAQAAMEATLRWTRVAHAALRLRCESLQWARDNASLQTRRDACFSQALTSVASGLVCWLATESPEMIVKILSSGLGPLCEFEGLLSLYAHEDAMWRDMVVAVEDLHTVQFAIVNNTHRLSQVPQVSGGRGALVVHLPVSEALYSMFTRKEHMTFTITVVFFNIGINDKATIAEALGDTLPQYHSNKDNYDRLHKYYHKYSRLVHDHMERVSSSSRSKPLEEVMENLRIAVNNKTPKNVKVLHLAALATRLMHGVRFTSCKSAKDRTGMSVTLEQVAILTSEYHLAEHEYWKALDVMRSEGTRRENTFKNIGVRKYAFSRKPVLALPKEYRPPPGTYGSTHT